ncbi:MAG: hypothetical protein U1F45_02095 [Burkholderiales bacterium]
MQDVDTVTITVGPVNDAPTVTAIADQTINQAARPRRCLTVGDPRDHAGIAGRDRQLEQRHAGPERQHRARRRWREPHDRAYLAPLYGSATIMIMSPTAPTMTVTTFDLIVNPSNARRWSRRRLPGCGEQRERYPAVGTVSATSS